MKKEKLNLEDVDKISGGIISGNYDGVEYKMQFDKSSGNYSVTSKGINIQCDETRFKGILAEAFGNDNVDDFLKLTRDGEIHRIVSKSE